jgi:nucleoside-diphosphate kinase
MAQEWFVSLCKPDSIERRLVGHIISQFEKRGLSLVDLKWIRMSESQIRIFYSDKATEPFFPELLAFLLSGPVVAAAWSAEDAVEKGRQVIGEKDPLKSEAGTIRGSMAADRIHSLVHGSRSPEEAWNELLILWPERFEGTPLPASERPAADAPKEVPTERAWSWAGEQEEAALEKVW